MTNFIELMDRRDGWSPPGSASVLDRGKRNPKQKDQYLNDRVAIKKAIHLVWEHR